MHLISLVSYFKLAHCFLQGFWMGVLTTSGSLSRVLGPICASQIYQHYGTYWLFSTVLVFLLIGLGLASIFYKRLTTEPFGAKTKQPVDPKRAEIFNEKAQTYASSETLPLRAKPDDTLA